MCEEKIGKIVIPEKKSTWSDEVTYKPLSEYVGERFELFLTEKRYDRDGRIASYSSDRKLSAAGMLTSQYLEEELGKKVEKLIANAKREVEESLIKSLEQNLKENLAKDTIERMNIPEVLKKLSSIGAKQVTGVYAETKGTYTKFKGTGVFQKEKRILHQKVTDVGIKASLQTGMVSINDRNRNQAIAVSITEMVAILNEALRYGTAGMGKKVRL